MEMPHLAVNGISPASFLSAEREYILKNRFLAVWRFMLRRRRSSSPSPSVRRLPTGLRHHFPRLTHHKLLRCLHDQAFIIQRLILVFGPDFWVAYTPVARPDSSVVAPLYDCIGLHYFPPLINGTQPVGPPSSFRKTIYVK
jgi:hypothetical protein